jgi:hypothetical protein
LNPGAGKARILLLNVAAITATAGIRGRVLDTKPEINSNDSTELEKDANYCNSLCSVQFNQRHLLFSNISHAPTTPWSPALFRITLINLSSALLTECYIIYVPRSSITSLQVTSKLKRARVRRGIIFFCSRNERHPGNFEAVASSMLDFESNESASSTAPRSVLDGLMPCICRHQRRRLW